MASRTPTPDNEDEIRINPLGGTRAQALNRLQVGVSLLLGVVLIVGLANVIENRAQQSDQGVVPEAAATVGPEPTGPAANDPLADAGVVPDLPSAPSATATAPAGAPGTGSDGGQ